MGLFVGQGVAAAAPSDSSSSQSAETSDVSGTEDTSDTPDTAAPDADSADADAADADSADADSADAPDDATGPDLGESTSLDAVTDLEEAAEVEVTEEFEVTEEADAVDEVADVALTADNAPPIAEGETPRESRHSPEPEPEPVASQPESVAVQPELVASADEPAAESVVRSSTAAAPAPSTMALAVPAVAQGGTTLLGLVSTRPVTVNSIATDVLTWVGLRPLADGLPTPATPVPALVQALWLAVRQNQYIVNNQRPTAAPTMSGLGPGGVVVGSLNAVDYDDTALAYTVTAAPAHGSLVIDTLGNFTYTPDAGTSIGGDSFTVAIDDTIGNPFHIHGLLGLLGITGPTQVSIAVPAPPPASHDDLASIDVTDLLARNGIEVTANSNGAVSLIDGRFTDHVVTTTTDAAAVMNALAPALGAVIGFADPEAITAVRAGVGSSVESFYRLSETIGGIEVLGSDVILVTDAGGAVTGLFNNYRGLAEGFDVTPAATVDEDAEVRLIAGTAYLGSADPEALESLFVLGTFTNELIVYALDDVAAPSLTWRVVVQAPDTGDMSAAGATYLIHADGSDAGDIIVAIANVRDATSTVVGNDWLGKSRDITVDSTSVFWFKLYSMFDATRDITTYKTSYAFFGFGGPVLPGSVVSRSWFGWDRAAVSAHANTAVVYDYYEDILGRRSFDGAGAPVDVSIRYNPRTFIFSSYANAFWDPIAQQFGYGDGGNLQAALDVVGHEFTHAVVSYVVGDGGSVLDYGESGALNEALADIFGSLIEGKSGRDRWLIGEDSSSGAIRNLANPGSINSGHGAYRSNYETRYTGSADSGGEHINSTIFSHAAYQMMTSSATSGVSNETWSRVFYQSLYRLTPGAEFTDGRAAVLSAATVLGFTAAQLGAIRDAFDSVGILGVAASSAIAA